MHNGSEDFENNGDDEASVDGSFTNSADQGVASDQEADQSNSDGVASNSNDIVQEGNELEEEEDMAEDEPQSENNESLMDFFKLLPYMYLLQKNCESNNNNGSITPAFEFTNTQIDANSNNLRNIFPMDSIQGIQNLRYLQQLLPNMLNGTSLNGFHHSNGNEGESDEEVEMNGMSEHEEPLDLTQKSKTISRVDEKSFRSNQRPERGYTIQDLEAALQDIQSGKLGTRRAAVIYGIPRSTLRNKVYKLGKNNVAAKPSMLYMGDNTRVGESEFGFINGSSSKRSHNGEESRGIGVANVGTAEEIRREAQKRFYNDNSPPLLRIDTLSQNGGGLLLDGQNNGGRGGRGGYNQRGRHNGSSPSLSLHNYPRAHGPGTSYDNYDDSSLGKKCRPKRGKYRNYDREALARAVQAVQNGEMSVHRAGSFFGVPHSTLEYKVKERHLLRQAKFKGKSTTKPNINKMSEQAVSFTTVTSLSSATADSNDSSTFQKTSSPVLGKSVSHYLNMKQSLGDCADVGERSELLLGLKESCDPVAFKKEINDAFPKIYDSNETL